MGLELSVGLGLAGWGFRRIWRMLQLRFPRRVFPPAFRALRVCSSRFFPPAFRALQVCSSRFFPPGLQTLRVCSSRVLPLWVRTFRLWPWGGRRRVSRWWTQITPWELGHQAGRIPTARSVERPVSEPLSSTSPDVVDLKRDPDVPEDRIVGVRVSSGAIDIHRGAVKLVPSDVLQPNACVQPGPK